MLKIIIMHCGVHRITINHHKFTEYVHSDKVDNFTDSFIHETFNLLMYFHL